MDWLDDVVWLYVQESGKGIIVKAAKIAHVHELWNKAGSPTLSDSRKEKEEEEYVMVWAGWEGEKRWKNEVRCCDARRRFGNNF